MYMYICLTSCYTYCVSEGYKKKTNKQTNREANVLKDYATIVESLKMRLMFI